MLSENVWQFDEIRYLRNSKYAMNENNSFFFSDIEMLVSVILVLLKMN